MAPQILRVDLRQDLQHLELLKTWPVRASAVVRGEMRGRAALITVLAWVLIADRARPVGREFLARARSALRLGAAGAAASWRRRWCSRS